MKAKSKNLLIIIACMGMFIGCSGDVDVEQEKTTLLETDRAFAEMSRTNGSAEAFHQFMTDDALLLISGGPVIRGKQTIYQRMMRNSNPSIVLDWTPEDADVSKTGDLGYSWGRYTKFMEDSTSSDREPIEYGKYVNVWEKQEDGSWKVKIDIGNNNPKPEDTP